MNCGAICLQYVHRSHGKQLSLPKARRLCKTSRKGTYVIDLIDALHTLGYKNPRLRRMMTWQLLKQTVARGNDVFVTWWSDLDSNGAAAPADGHWSVVRKVTKDTITLFDPDPEEEITLPRMAFEARWFDYEKDHAGKRDDFIRAAVIARFGGSSESKTKKTHSVI